MKVYDGQGKELMTVSAIERDGNAIVLKGKILGAMPMTAKLYPDEARAALKLVTPRLFFFLLTFLVRKGRKKNESNA